MVQYDVVVEMKNVLQPVDHHADFMAPGFRRYSSMILVVLGM